MNEAVVATADFAILAVGFLALSRFGANGQPGGCDAAAAERGARTRTAF